MMTMMTFFRTLMIILILDNNDITTKHRKTTDGVGCLNTLMNLQ